MIKSTTIRNIQGHEEVKIDWHSGVNVIKGTSDSGKSTIIRGIRWALKNRPRGDVLRSNFEEDRVAMSEVEMEFSPDGWVRRRKNLAQINEYRIGTPTVGELQLKALRSDVPDEVHQISQISDVNLQYQHDTYFLIQDSPGAVAKKLNEVVGLEVIDEIMSKVNRKLGRLNARIEVRKSDEKELNEALKKYKNIVEVEFLVQEIDELLKREEEMKYEQNSLVEITEHIAELEETAEGLKAWLEIKKDISELEKKTDHLKILTRSRDTLIELVQTIQRAERMREKAAQKLLALNNQYDTKLKTLNICPLCGQQIPKAN